MTCDDILGLFNGPHHSADRIAKPNWEFGRSEWEWYVPTELQDVWDSLSSDAQALSYLRASEACSCADLFFEIDSIDS